MDTTQVKPDFNGFGPLPNAKTTASVGYQDAFAPAMTAIGGMPPRKLPDKIQVYSQGPTDGQGFSVDVNHFNEQTNVYLSNTELTEYLALKTDTNIGEASVYGYSGNANQNFILSANDTDIKTRLVLFNEDNAEYLEMKIDGASPEATVYGYANSASEYYFLKAKPSDTQLFLFGGGGSVKVDIPFNDSTPLNAYWQEIDICVDGVAKKMQVLGTEPYDPPA
jgi:hypothetical protein